MGQVRRVVIGYDGSQAAGAALDFGLDHAKRHHLDARVVAVHSPHDDEQRVTQHDLARAVQSRQPGPVAELIHVPAIGQQICLVAEPAVIGRQSLPDAVDQFHRGVVHEGRFPVRRTA
ncbi:universal stress protein [Kribbella sp. NPDC023972]|uniref:universal stress protein n=1 Tax=Kribbella sp. NPDC023972 TaxID=3154795 RepID=UPI0033CDB0B9